MSQKMTSSIKAVQKIIDAIYKLKAPTWYVDLMAKMQKAAWETVVKFTVDEVALIKAKITEVESEDLTGTEKFTKVFEYCESEIKNKTETELKTMIQNIFTTLKDSISS